MSTLSVPGRPFDGMAPEDGSMLPLSRSRERLTTLLAVSFFLGMFLSRPFWLGLEFGVVGVAILLAVGFLSAASGYDRVLLHNGLKLAGAISILFSALAVHSALLSNSGAIGSLLALLTNSAAAFGAAMHFSNRRVGEKTFRLLIYFVCISAISALLSFFLLFIGISPAAITIARLPVEDEFYGRFGDVLFPVTIVYNYAYYAGVNFPRVAMGFREVGIAQAFIGWAMIAVYFHDGRVRPIILGLMSLALLATQSTSLVLTAFIVMAFYLYAARIHILVKLLLSVLAAVISWQVYQFWLNDPVFGLAAKAQSSVSDRTDAVSRSLELLAESPFGTGLYNSDAGNVGINLVAQTSQVGIIGMACIVAMFIYAHRARSRHAGSLVPYLPILATAATTQPLLDAPAFYALLFVVFPALKSFRERRNQKRSELRSPSI